MSCSFTQLFVTIVVFGRACDAKLFALLRQELSATLAGEPTFVERHVSPRGMPFPSSIETLGDLAQYSCASEAQTNRSCPELVKATDSLTRQLNVLQSYGGNASLAAKKAQHWMSLPQPELPPQTGPKVAILMLVSSSVDNAQVWRSWMDDAKIDGQDFAFHIHASSGHLMTDSMREFLVNETIPTSWCNLYHAQQYLIGKALEDRAVSHMVFATGDSAPIMTLSEIHEELRADASSRMCFDLAGIRAETWTALRRDDAELFHQNAELVRSMRSVQCLDEDVWLEPLLLRQIARSGPTRGPKVRDQCIMMADWCGDKPHNWCRDTDSKSLAHLREELHENASIFYPGHPRAYHHVSSKSWGDLQQSGYWMGRKFTPGAFDDILPHSPKTSASTPDASQAKEKTHSSGVSASAIRSGINARITELEYELHSQTANPSTYFIAGALTFCLPITVVGFVWHWKLSDKAML